jgi:hypothetical protein
MGVKSNDQSFDSSNFYGKKNMSASELEEDDSRIHRPRNNVTVTDVSEGEYTTDSETSKRIIKGELTDSESASEKPNPEDPNTN